MVTPSVSNEVHCSKKGPTPELGCTAKDPQERSSA